MEAVAVHPDMAILFVILLVLAIAILILAWDLLARPRRRVSEPAAPKDNDTFNDNFEDVLRAVEVNDPRPTPADKPADQPADFVFRRHLTPPLSTPVEQAKKTPEAHPAPPPKIEFSTIQNEIRAALGQAAQSPRPVPAPAPHTAMLSWAESGSLAVLSLGDADPEIAWPLLQTHGIHILVVPEGHPFPPPNRTIELLCLADIDEAAMATLIAGLRAKLAKGERIAFYTETGLTGPAALLAARLTNRTA